MQFDQPYQYYTEGSGDPSNINIVMTTPNGKVSGYLLAIPQSRIFDELRRWDIEMQGDPCRLYLEMIQILPEQRGNKLGLRLIREVCEEAEKRNFSNLSMHARVITGWSKYLLRIFAEIRVLRRIENLVPVRRTLRLS